MTLPRLRLSASSRLSAFALKLLLPISLVLALAAPLHAQKVLRLGNGSEPQDLDPQIVTGTPEHQLVEALFEGLVGFAADGESLEPAAAASWDISPDGLTYTFRLRPEAKWSDGHPVTAQDFARSYERILTPAFAAEYANKLFPLKNAEAFFRGQITDFAQVGIRTPDAHTLVLTLDHPTPYLLGSMTHYSWNAVPVHLIEKLNPLTAKGSRWTRPEHFVGNGPFVLKEWSINQRIVVTKSPTYWDRENIRIDEVQYYPTEDLANEERMFRAGQLDKTYDFLADKTPAYQKQSPELLHINPYLGIYFYRINVTQPPLNDKRVRRALALAINREQIAERVMKQGQTPAYNACPPMAAYPARQLFKADLAEARRLLAEAGFPGGKGFPKIELLYNTHQNHKKIAEVLQQLWRVNLGIDITLNNQEWKVYLDTMDRLGYAGLARGGWIADYIDPSTFFDLWRTGDGNNDTGWSNPEYDRLLAESMKTPDNATRMALYAKMDELLMDEMPIIPVYFYTRTTARNPKLVYTSNVLDTPLWKHIYFKD